MFDQPAHVRPYHVVALAQMPRTSWTHVETCGVVVYVRQMQDGDLHVTLSDGKVKVVAEIIPAIPLAPPTKGRTIAVRGIARIDKRHLWAEIHPVESWQAVERCAR